LTIKVNQATNEFHLYNDQVSYIFRVLEKSNQLEHLYFGKKIKHRDSFQHLIEREYALPAICLKATTHHL
jgi:alpha-galactosidase